MDNKDPFVRIINEETDSPSLTINDEYEIPWHHARALALLLLDRASQIDFVRFTNNYFSQGKDQNLSQRIKTNMLGKFINFVDQKGI